MAAVYFLNETFTYVTPPFLGNTVGSYHGCKCARLLGTGIFEASMVPDFSIVIV
jgi:hypothetical protein